MKRIVYVVVILIALLGLYESRLIHGIWFSRNLYHHVYEPQQEQRELQERAKRLRDDINAFKQKGAK